MLKITITTPVYPYPKRGVYTGIERHIENISKYLALNNCKVRVITTFWNGGNSYDIKDGIEIFRVKDATLYLGRAAGLAELNYLSFSLTSILKSLELDSDVLLLNNQSPFSFLSNAKLKVGLAHHVDYIKNFKDIFVIPFADLYSKMTKIDYIIAPSYFTKKQIIETFKIPSKKIEVIHEGVDTSKFNPNNKPIFRDKFKSQYVILFVGALVKTKNVDKLIRVFNYVQKRIDASLVIVGEGPEKSNLMKIVKELNLTNKVFFEGFVKDEDLPYYYSSCDIFASCSIIEGFGLIFLEAMASGKPVVAFNIASISEVVGNGGIIIKNFDLKEMAEKIIELLSNKEVYEEYSRKAREIAINHDWNIIARKYLNFFEKSLKVMKSN
ncbi:MAG: glycosyltransferase family 4 protein [Thermoproteota archaeon]|jgi:glycosyltransferase involved in cell wall biosynthesis|nr:glycosyltransferase family 4 protein [Thermoproteota archaeon]